MKRYSLLLLAVFSCLTASSAAEVYRYKDTSGKLHYVTSESQVPQQYRGQLQDAPKLPRIGKMPAQKYEEQTPNRKKTERPIVLVMRGCGYCNMLEILLKKKDIRYTRYDIHTSRKGSMMYDQLGRGGVPITKIGSTIIRGYQPGPILSALER